MGGSKLQKVNISSQEGILHCTISLDQESDTQPQFAYYIFRNYERIHTEWYTTSNSFAFDTKGRPGCYHVQGFARFSDDRIEQNNSSTLFLNPLEVTPETFPNADESSVAFSLKGKNWLFPALFYPSAEKSLYVLMPSAVNRKKSVIPSFNRWTWAKDGVFPGNVLCVSDPTLELHSDLEIGWCLGNKDHCATTELAEFVTCLAESKGIPAGRITIYGSSAGGFAALALAAQIEGSVAVAINPQVDALSYSAADQVDLVAETCFGATRDFIRQHFTDRVDMNARWKSVSSSKAFFVQNIEDGHHYKVHFKPMWTDLGGDPEHEGVSYAGRHTAWLYRQEGGHVPETKEMANKIVEILNKQ